MTTNYSVGHDAEKSAAKYLETLGYEIRELNWKTKYCEIDIVAQKNNVIYMVEVKYRKSAAQGDGFEYITPKKLNQMKFAAKFWVQMNKFDGDYRLAALSITAGDYEFVEIT